MLADGLLEREGEILICDIARLEDAAEMPDPGDRS